MRTTLTALLGAASVTIPALAGGFTTPDKGAPTMTKKEILAAWKTMSFKEGGQLFKIGPLLGAKEAVASGGVLDRYEDKGLVGHQFPNGVKKWMFVAVDDGDFDDEGALTRVGDGSMINFEVELAEKPKK